MTHVSDTLQSPILLASLITREQRKRFYAQVQSTGERCWEWAGPRDSWMGYGRFYIGSQGTRNIQIGVHRLAWALENPKVDLVSEDFICHKCDNPPCCRVEHLYLGNAATNNRDMAKRGRMSTRKLTEGDVYEIRASQEPPWVLAERYSVSEFNVISIQKRWAWHWLEEDDLEALFGT